MDSVCFTETVFLSSPSVHVSEALFTFPLLTLSYKTQVQVQKMLTDLCQCCSNKQSSQDRLSVLEKTTVSLNKFHFLNDEI